MLRLHHGVMNARFQKPLAISLLVLSLASPAVTGPGVDAVYARPNPQSTDDPPANDNPQIGFDRNASTVQLLESAREMFIADRYEIAEMLYKSILVREPENLSAMLELAVIYEARGQLQYARGLLTRALVIRPYDEEIIDRNAHIAKKLSRTLEAEVDLLLDKGDYETALPKLSILLTTQPENADLNYKKAFCHLRLGRPQAALTEVDRALNLRREQHYYDLKQEATALIHGTQMGSLIAEAQSALRGGDPADQEDALQIIGRILELEPDHAWAKEQFLALTDTQRADRKPLTAFGKYFGKGWDVVTRIASATGVAILVVYPVLKKHYVAVLSLLLIILILYSPLTHVLIRGFSPRQSLAGRLGHFSIQEVLALVNTHQRTGVLSLSADSVKGRIYFDSGEIYHCSSRGVRGRGALQLLIREAQDGFFVFRDGVTSRETTIDTPLSLILLELPERVDTVTSKSILKKRQSKMRSMLEKQG
ncbi:MAG: tetratricopeptide repeat protein [Candidatus Krumholzibacteria bacterium]|nr:tetratricopeptide repeat protein [Candidatus Krumholzibacteria bacterium]